ncbi:MAG: PIN domain-containing protein [Nitrososphaera sp.]|nr:PIN domain-containing protein [Nitrososphaera sp.]
MDSQRDFQVLVDSDAFIARSLPDDMFHSHAVGIFERLDKEQASLVITSLVVLETATVLSYRGGQALAKQFLSRAESSQIAVVHIDENLQHEAIQLFKAQEGRGVSLVDCANAVVATRYNIPTIFSFDHFYTKRLKLKVAQ